MTKLLLAVTLSLLTTSAFAGATLTLKGTNSQGSPIGVASSQATGNGDWVGGNGTGDGTLGAGDQTTYPGSRADLVHQANGIPPGQAKK